MAAYHIMINEAQREALEHVLGGLVKPEVVTDTDMPLQYWVDMLKDLPSSEAEHPGTLHGFCL